MEYQTMEPKMKYFGLHPYVGIIQIRYRVLSQLGLYQAPRAFVLINVQLNFKFIYCSACFYLAFFFYSAI